MKRMFIIYIVQVIGAFLISILFNGRDSYDMMTGVGLLNLIFSVIGIIAGLIVRGVGDKELGKDMIGAAGLLLLTGFGICSTFPFHLN